MADKEYIERGALLKRFEELHDGGNWLVNDYNADWIHSFIENAPAADVVEVRHGEWLYVHTYLRGRCSICQSPMQYDNQPYCANCGAKMDGERKEQT